MLNHQIGLRLLAGSLVLSLSACVPQGANRWDKFERDISDMRSVQAEQTTQIADLQSQVRSLNGKIEELQYGQQNKLGGDLNKLQADISTIKRKLPPPAIVPIAPLEADEAYIDSQNNETSKFMGNGFLKLRDGSFGDALALFQEALSTSYNSDAYPLVLFWIAVTNEGMGENTSAVKAYHELSSNYPKHPRTPLALLRQASVFVRLRDSSTARLTLQKLITEFPKSAEASDAKARLKSLKG